MALSAIDFLAEDGRVNVLEQLLLRGRQREDGLLVGLLAELRAAAEDVLQEVALAAGAQEQHAQLVADVEEEVRVLARVLAHAVRQRADSAGERETSPTSSRPAGTPCSPSRRRSASAGTRDRTTRNLARAPPGPCRTCSPAWELARSPTRYTPKSFCSHTTSMSAPWRTFMITGSVKTSFSNHTLSRAFSTSTK